MGIPREICIYSLKYITFCPHKWPWPYPLYPDQVTIEFLTHKNLYKVVSLNIVQLISINDHLGSFMTLCCPWTSDLDPRSPHTEHIWTQSPHKPYPRHQDLEASMSMSWDIGGPLLGGHRPKWPTPRYPKSWRKNLTPNFSVILPPIVAKTAKKSILAQKSYEITFHTAL